MTFYDLLRSHGDFDGHIYCGTSNLYKFRFRWDHRWVLGRRWYLAYSWLMEANAVMFSAQTVPVLELSLRSVNGLDRMEIDRDNLPALIKASIDERPAILQHGGCGFGMFKNAVKAREVPNDQYSSVNSLQLDNGALVVMGAQIDSDNTRWCYELFPPTIYLTPTSFSVSFVQELESFVSDIEYATKEFDVSDTDSTELFL